MSYSSYTNDITEQYLNKIYDDLQKEQMRMMNDMKTGTDDDKSKSITKQISLINSINMSILRLRNLKNVKE